LCDALSEVPLATAFGPTIPRRRLRSELRTARDAAGLTQEQVAHRLEWSVSKIIRIEAGAVGVSTTDLRALLNVYGLRGAEHVEELVDLARMSRKRSWWSAIKEERISLNQRMLIGLETETTTVHHYHSMLVPGLLQTEAYATAIIRDCGVPPPTQDSVQTRLHVRLTRQRQTLQRSNPPQLNVIVDEVALRRPVGDPTIARQQLNHLLELGREPHISIRVVPLHAGAHPGIVFGGIAILQFEDSADADVVYVEGGEGDSLSDESEKISMYWTIMNRLQEKALTTEDSARLIARIKESIGD
jgi:transcriptional regulator with XRE-family HTH domain